jgi:hypothetical protein
VHCNSISGACRQLACKHSCRTALHWHQAFDLSVLHCTDLWHCPDSRHPASVGLLWPTVRTVRCGETLSAQETSKGVRRQGKGTSPFLVRRRSPFYKSFMQGSSETKPFDTRSPEGLISGYCVKWETPSCQKFLRVQGGGACAVSVECRRNLTLTTTAFQLRIRHGCH